MAARKVKSEAQDAVELMVRQAFPWMSVRQEVPLREIAAERGFDLSELRDELRRTPSDMPVDVYATDYRDAVAFEYQGEQHYRAVGRMNATAAELRHDQELDEDKAWVLRRLGVPIVQIPYDMPLDVPILRRMAEEAEADAAREAEGMVPCEGCGRLFPPTALRDGECVRCRREAAEAARAACVRDGGNEAPRRDRRPDDPEWVAERRREARERRREAAREMRESEWYRARAEEAREEARRRRREEQEAFKGSEEHRRMLEEARRRRREASEWRRRHGG